MVFLECVFIGASIRVTCFLRRPMMTDRTRHGSVCQYAQHEIQAFYETLAHYVLIRDCHSYS